MASPAGGIVKGGAGDSGGASLQPPGAGESGRGPVFPSEAWDRLVQFETHLKAIERFFNLENHPARSSGPIAFQDNLATEVGLAERQFRHLVHLGRGIMDESDANLLAFRSYVESEWAGDAARDALLAEYSDQKTWRDSLYLLLEGLQSLAVLAAGLRAASSVNLATFRALGQQFRSLMVHNRFFSPVRARPVFLFAERLTHPVLRRAVVECPSDRFRRAMALVLSIFMRHLRVLSWVEVGSDRRDELLDALPLLTLLRSDFVILRPFLEKAFPKRFFSQEETTHVEEELRGRIDGFSFELQVEARKAFEAFLLDFTQTTSVKRMRGSIEAAHGLLTALLEQAVVAVVGVTLPGTADKDIFPSSVMRRQQSLRLREDLWLFGEVLGHVIELLMSSASPDGKRLAYRGLLDFLTYFENLSMQFVRYSDREPFEHFCREMRALRDERFTDPLRCEDIASNFDCFRVFIQTILGLVNLRADLHSTVLDEVRAKRALMQFVRVA
jgi:hypothetical protein